MSAALMFAVLCAAAPVADSKTSRTWHQLVGVLQYVEGDYRKAIALHDLEELAEQKLNIATAKGLLHSLKGAAAPYEARLDSIQKRIEAEQDPEGVGRDCRELAQSMLRDQLREPAPDASPDLQRGASLWATQCAMCHGLDGAANTPMALGLTPRPARFDDETLAELTPYKVFNTTMFGVSGTAMPSFTALSEADRWAVAFYVFTLRSTGCDHQPPAVTLRELAGATDAALSKVYSDGELACLRLSIPTRTNEPLPRAGLEAARVLYAAGKRDAARAAVVETWQREIEPRLATVSPSSRDSLEQAYGRATRGEHFDASTSRLVTELQALETAPTHAAQLVVGLLLLVATAVFVGLRSFRHRPPRGVTS